MKKLLTTAAVCGLVVAAAPAHADIDLNLGGHFKGYGSYVKQDDGLSGTTVGGAVRDVRKFDILRETEIHFTGETTLDNGLTVGFHAEADVDGRAGSNFDVEESYLYVSGAWGRVNVGLEDGAAYLLQVAAPSADDNVDGIRQYINPVNYDPALGITNIDYANDITKNSDKITYLSPVFSGFQVGASYTPEVTPNGHANAFGNRLKGTERDAWEASARYQGNFNDVGVTVGAGYTHIKVDTVPGADNFKEWNVGANVNFAAFGVGAVYTKNNAGGAGVGSGETDRTWVAGVDYTTGPFKLGVSYFDNKNEDFGGAGVDLKTKRYSGGVTYTYGPGLTFRGSIGRIEHKETGASKEKATYVLLGTQVNF